MSERFCDVREFGAVGDGATDCTKAIQAAIDACEDGILLSGGVYLSGALFLKSGVHLCIRSDATLLGSQDPSLYPMMRYSFEGVEQDCYASLINTTEGPHSNIRISGGGCIDANGLLLAARELPGVRGRAVCLRNCRNVDISGVRLLHAPAWCLHLIGCSGVHISNILIDSDYVQDSGLFAYADNDDGIVIDSCADVVVQDSQIRSHDDCVSIKSGKGQEARLHGRPTERVRISNCVFRLGSGVAIGSEMSGGIENVVIEDCRFLDCFSLFCLKTARSRGGYIRHIRVRNCALESRDPGIYSYRRHRGMIFMDASYKEASSAEGVPAEVSDIIISNVRMDTPARTAVYIHGFADRPFSGIVLSDIRSTCDGPNDIQDAEVIYETTRVITSGDETLRARQVIRSRNSAGDIQKREDGKTLIIALTGRLDGSTAAELEKLLKASIDGMTELTFDFDALEYISSAGLRVLLEAQKTAKTMKLIHVGESIMEIFRITGFSEMMDIQPGEA